ncbi:glycoside hydrolase 5 family protein [Mariniflexile sp.]|uniref:glycoside hydrolase 5 family protein n=2 Tax=Mariniflexile sp. TaxID=1979402 RepID=UPI00404787EA
MNNMRKNRLLSIIIASTVLVSFGCKTSKITTKPGQNSFIKVENGNFIKNDKAYTFIGANYWQGMNLGAPENGDQKRLISELDQLQKNGITNLRILAASEGDEDMRYAIHPALQTGPGEYNEDLWDGLDFLLSEMAKRNMTAVMVMGNFWTWSGGFPQYLKWSGQGTIPFPQDEDTSWDDFTNYSKLFYTNETAKKLMENHLEKTINRKNSITGARYKNDPTIMAWQLSNEPRGYDVPDAFRAWTQKTAAFIKSLDKNHMVCLGTEGNTPSDSAGIHVLKDNDNPNIDYITNLSST